jgi:hypothetical protein
MKMLMVLVAALAVGVLAAGDAFAFSCPSLVKSANEAIAAAEPKVNMGDDRQKARNAGMVSVAKDLSKQAEADHGAGKHAESEAKAKAARFLAEQVK